VSQPPPALTRGSDNRRRCWWGASTPDYERYHDEEWGRPVTDDRGIYERLTLEAFQSGLSWSTILNKRDAFREAFAGFDADVVAAYDESDALRLMADPRIVRNRRKIDATLINARATVALREDGGLEEFVQAFRPDRPPVPTTTEEMATTSPESVALSKALKKHGFAFVGPTTMFAMLEALGVFDPHLVGCHRRGTIGG
jgi:DNA-3-methyladenine glycosylase I